MPQVPIIAFPENITYHHSRKPKTLIYLIKILYGSGILLTSIYLIAILLLSPLLELQFDRRLELLQKVNDRLRSSVYAKIVRRLPDVPNVIVKYGEKLYSDASMQTSNDDKEKSYTKTVRFEDEIIEEPVDLNIKLQNLKKTLLKLEITNYESEKDDEVAYNVSEMQPLTFQLKQLQSYLDLINERIFKKNIRGYEFFQRSARTGKPTTSNNIMVDLKKQVRDLRSHTLRNY